MFKNLTCFVVVSVVLLLSCLTTFALPTFTDVTQEAQVGDIGLGLGVACGDYDGDGDLDLYVARGGWGNMNRDSDTLYRNDGGIFTKDAQLKHAEKGFDSVFVDYDNDGDLDFFLGTVEGVFLYRNRGRGVFDNATAETGLKAWMAFTAAFGDYDKDGHLDIYLPMFGANLLYRSNGDGTFTNVTPQAKVADNRQSFLGHFFDYDNDSDLDIYVLNAEGWQLGVDNTDLLYRNDGNDTFTEVGQKAGVRNMGNGRCAISSDYDNDGDLDLFVGGRVYNVLYQNNDDGTFTDVTKDTGLNPSLPGEVACFGDYDNDGYLDLYITQWDQPNSLYHNNGDGTFTEVARKAGVAVEGLITTGTIFFDYNNDGDLDIFVVTRNAPQKLFRNDGTDNNWLQVKLIGMESNRDGIGARVTVEAGNLKMMREINSGSFRVHPGMTAHFGMGSNESADRIIVHWPSDVEDVLNDIPVNQVIVIKEGGGIVEGMAVEPESKDKATWGEVKSPDSSEQLIVNGSDKRRPMTDKLLQNYPSLANPDTWIPFELSKGAKVTIQIYDSQGEFVRKLDLGWKEAGIYRSKERAVHWNGRNEVGECVASGVYFYVMQAGKFTTTRKMVIAR